MFIRSRLLFAACLAVTLIPTAVFTIWLLSWVPYGLDLTDEGYYLNLITNPFNYRISTTQFGYFYYLFFYPLGGSVAAMRAANLLFTLGLGSVLMYLLLIGSRRASAEERFVAAALAFSLAFAGLLCSASQRPTPNYNWLNLQGLLLVAIALVVMRSRSSRWIVAACLMLATGGWMSFLAKAPSAVLLAVAVSAYLLAAGQLTLPRIVVTIAATVALLTATALSIDGSITMFAERLDLAMKGSAILDPRYSWADMFRLGWADLPAGEEYNLLWLSLMVTACTLLCAAKDGRMLVAGLVGAVAIAFIPVVMRVYMDSLYPATWRFGYELQASAAAMGLFLALVVLTLLRKLHRADFVCIAYAVLLLFFPYFYSFGTNNNYWNISGSAVIFWIAAAVTLAAQGLPRNARGLTSLVPTAVATSAISTAVLLIGVEFPYREPEPLRLVREFVEVGPNKTQLVVGQELARYLSTVGEAAHSAGFRRGAPMVDLTGRSPGALHALGAKPIGQAWMIGGYPGSEELAALLLAKVPCVDLAEAWLLEEADGPRMLPRAVLGGSQLQYELVADFPSTRSGYEEPFEQRLMRPAHNVPEAVRRCEARAQ